MHTTFEYDKTTVTKTVEKQTLQRADGWCKAADKLFR